MNYITALIDHFLAIPVEKFTDKLISAFQIAEVDGFPKTEKDKLLYIEKETDVNTKISFYKLDRKINPETTGFKRTVNYAIFTNSDKEEKRMSEDQIQSVLCTATRRIAQIVMINTKDHNLEFKRPGKMTSTKNKIHFD